MARAKVAHGSGWDMGSVWRGYHPCERKAGMPGTGRWSRAQLRRSTRPPPKLPQPVTSSLEVIGATAGSVGRAYATGLGATHDDPGEPQPVARRRRPSPSTATTRARRHPARVRRVGCPVPSAEASRFTATDTATKIQQVVHFLRQVVVPPTSRSGDHAREWCTRVPVVPRQ